MEVKTKFVQLIADYLATPVDSIEETLSLEDDLGLDSLDMVECIMEAEEEFGIMIPDSEIQHAKTVGDCIKIINNIVK